MYKPAPNVSPQTRNAKNPLLNHPSKYKPPRGRSRLLTAPARGLYLEIALKYKVRQSKNGKFPSKFKALAQSVLKRKFPSIDKPLQI